MVDQAKTFMVEDARILFRNFSGETSQYNTKGERNFVVILDPDVAEVMRKDGWNIKLLSAMDEEEPGDPYIQVAIRFDVRPPRVTLITSTSRTQLDETTIGILDWADIMTVDLIARGYDWTVGDKSGTKAYLQTMFVTIQEDALERKYAILDEGRE